MPSSLQDAIVAVSLANLSFLSAWLVLLNRMHYSFYTWAWNPGFSEFYGLAFDILLLAILFWFFATLARRFKRAIMQFARWAFLLALIVPVNSLLHHYSESASLNFLSQHKFLTAASLTATPFALWAVMHYVRLATKIAVSMLLVLSPLALVNLCSALWLRHKYCPSRESFAARSAPPLNQAKSAPHVFWIVFDEMDQYAAFDGRPTLALPELDRLRHEAIFAERAYPPAGFTLMSMPALISGKFIAGVTPLHPDELEIQFPDQTKSGWSTQPSVFSRAREMGFKTGVVGWYHPYCRVLGSTLDFCRWEQAVDESNFTRGQLTVAGSMRVWAHSLLYAIPFVFRALRINYDAQRREDHITEYKTLLQYAREVSTRPDLNLVLLHFPVPHAPWIYDGEKGTLSSSGLGSTYIDNLALADRTLGELRQSLATAGLWDQSAILVTSDHWWRESPTLNGRRDHRVPFILKLPGQKEGRVFSEAFNTIATNDLLLSILQRKFPDADSTLQWLHQHRSAGESEFTTPLP